ncbi:protein FAM136A-like isoform X2 [Liolophura sinensis]|uniref:protein FAM136A-like isoform X2 n=1 Tax=Liolophura sinensis TaxID=3198878 RepID=UPI00315816C9
MADMYKCSAKCCENPKSSLEDVQRCVDQCSQPVNKAQSFVHNELQNYQGRLQRCAMDCQDKIRDKVKPDSADSEVSKYKGEMETCVLKCVDSHIDLLPSLLKRMKEVLSKGK